MANTSDDIDEAYTMSKNNDHFYVEYREDVFFAALRGVAKRASVKDGTQGAVLEMLKQKHPDAPVHIERVRTAKPGHPDKWL